MTRFWKLRLTNSLIQQLNTSEKSSALFPAPYWVKKFIDELKQNQKHAKPTIWPTMSTVNVVKMTDCSANLM